MLELSLGYFIILSAGQTGKGSIGLSGRMYENQLGEGESNSINCQVVSMRDRHKTHSQPEQETKKISRSLPSIFPCFASKNTSEKNKIIHKN